MSLNLSLFIRGIKRSGLAVLLLAGLSVAAPQEAAAYSVQARIETMLRTAAESDPELGAFYRERRFRPVWVRGDDVRREAYRLIDIIRAGGGNTDVLEYLVDEARAGSEPALAETELRLTQAMLRHAREAGRPAGVEMAYVDRELAPGARETRPAPRRRRGLGLFGGGRSEREIRERLDALGQMNPIMSQLRNGLAHYRATWGRLPQVDISSGRALRVGSNGARVRTLRRRLGLPEGDRFDATVEQAVRLYQQVHGLDPVDGIVGSRTITSLNRGSAHYERLIMANMERARTIPGNPGRRYIVVDAASATLTMFQDGRAIDSMRVIVGKPTEQTPMMAANLRYVMLNPYWNIPNDLVQRRIAPGVLQNGMGWFRERGYEVLSDWTETARTLDPNSIDWADVAAGRREVRVRQLPGPDNFMGAIKFMLPNDFGIYLHDTPDRHLFDAPDRRLSSGCVRVENWQRLASWLFNGRIPRATSRAPEQRVDLRAPVPVYITYMTAAPTRYGIAFHNDIYERDGPLLARLGNDDVAARQSSSRMTASRR